MFFEQKNMFFLKNVFLMDAFSERTKNDIAKKNNFVNSSDQLK